MRFSIISVCYNNVLGLKNTLGSLINQSFNDWEMIVVDGASSDTTISFLNSVSDKRINWRSEPDDSIYHAMNKGTLRATGDYLVYLNAGDIFADRYVLQKLDAVIQDHYPDFLFGRAIIDQDITIPPRSVTKELVSDWVIKHEPNHQAIFVRNAIAKSTKYDEQYRICADLDFKLRLLSNFKWEFVDLDVCRFYLDGVSNVNSLVKQLEIMNERNRICNLRGYPHHRWSFFRVLTKYLLLKFKFFSVVRFFRVINK